jgi:2'-5' RNA ligase
MAAKKDIGSDYKNKAREHCDILFKVSIKGVKKLSDEIPLHMSLKVFNDIKEFSFKEVRRLVKDLNIKSPDPKKLEFEATIFHSEHTDTDYYMLSIKNADPAYEKFYKYFDGRGITHKKFMAHITINKELYDEIKENGLTPYNLKFGPLTIEDGANNTVYTFEETLEKSEKHDAEFPIGQLKLIPSEVREIVNTDYTLKQNYQKAMALRGDDLKRYLEDNPQLEAIVAKKLGE